MTKAKNTKTKKQPKKQTVNTVNKNNAKLATKRQSTKPKTTKKTRSTSKKQSTKSARTEPRIKITKDTTLAEILTVPGAYNLLASLGVPCMICPLMGQEMHFLTLENICKMYNLDLEKILKELEKL